MSNTTDSLKEFLTLSPSVVYPDEVLELFEPIETEITILASENYKLRELMQYALTALDNNCAKCAYRDSCKILQDCKCIAPDRLRKELNELNIEVQ